MTTHNYILRYGRHQISGQIGGLLDYAGKLGLENFEVYDIVNDRVTLCINNGVVVQLDRDLDRYGMTRVKEYLAKSYDAATGGACPIKMILGGCAR